MRMNRCGRKRQQQRLYIIEQFETWQVSIAESVGSKTGHQRDENWSSESEQETLEVLPGRLISKESVSANQGPIVGSYEGRSTCSGRIYLREPLQPFKRPSMTSKR